MAKAGGLALWAATGSITTAWGADDRGSPESEAESPLDDAREPGDPEFVDDRTPNSVPSADGAQEPATPSEPDGASESVEPGPPAVLAEPLPAEPLAGVRGLDPAALNQAEDEAYRLYLHGKEQFEAGDAAAAEQTFALAIRALPDDAPYARSRGSLALWWVWSHIALYESTGEPTLLEREERILDAYVEHLDEIAVSKDDRLHKLGLVAQRRAEIADTRTLAAAAHDDIQTQLEAEHKGYHASTWRPDLLQDLAWHRRRDDPRTAAVQARDHGDEPGRTPDQPEVPEPRRRRGVGLVVTGALSLMAGGAGMGVMTVGMTRASAANDFDPAQSPVERRAQIAAGLDANTMSITGAVTGGVLLVTGIILTTTGARRLKRSRAEDDQQRVSVGPWGLTGRF